MSLSLTIHGHFYQPPRENPFLDEVETEASAAPFHDWNQRIERECYRAVAAARLTGQDGRIRGVMNTLEWISFNFGPTLLEWMEREAPATYRDILAADRASAARLGGHGNAIAQPYHHTILPLASLRDKRTEVRWGITDFRRRFGRDPEGMWLPETAVDDETLDVLAAEGIRFTIVAPHQVAAPPPRGLPGRYTTRNGRTIALCVYRGDLSHAIAFGGMLHNAEEWVARMVTLGSELAGAGGRTPTPGSVPAVIAHPPAGVPLSPTGAHPGVPTPVVARPAIPDPAAVRGIGGGREVLLSAATDGETYGHHHRFGEMALARALEEMARLGARIENFASFLARVPATTEVALVEPTAWSCAHGVERWRADCGCRIDAARHPSQAWRAPLRGGLAMLAGELHALYEREGAALFATDPWAARDAYGAVVARGADELQRFAHEVARPGASPADLVRARELLEIERDALRMFTSCAWFFDDIGGLEPQQVLRYAARAISLAGAEGPRLEGLLLEHLARAGSNDPAVGTGRDVYLRHARPALPALVRLAGAAVAAARVGASTREHFTTTELDLTSERVRVADRRTSRRAEFAVRDVRPSTTDVHVLLAGEDGTTYQLALADLPERPRLAIRSVLRRALLPRCLTDDELASLLSGDATLAGLLRVALIRTVARLDEDLTPATMQLVSDLLDLFEQFEARIPFDAQTAFWRLWQDLTTEQRAQFAPLGTRLGFAVEDVDGPALDAMAPHPPPA